MKYRPFNSNNPVTSEIAVEIACQLLIRTHEPASLPLWFLKGAVLSVSKDKQNNFCVEYCVTPAKTGEPISCFTVIVNRTDGYPEIFVDNIFCDIKDDDIIWPSK
jgi:hypothetical protein